LIADTITLNDEAGKVTGGNPCVDINNNGRGIACWEDDRVNASYLDIYCQQFRFTDSTLEKAGSNFYANDDYPACSSSINIKASPDCAINDDSIIVIVWADGRNYEENPIGQIMAYKMKGTFPLSAYTTNRAATCFHGKFSDLLSCSVCACDGGCSGCACVRCTTSYNELCPGYQLNSLDPNVAISDSTYVVHAGTHISGNHYGYFRVCRLSDDYILKPDAVSYDGGSGVNIYGGGVAMNKQGNFVISYTKAAGLGTDIVYLKYYNSNGSLIGSYTVSGDSCNYVDVGIDNLNYFTTVFGNQKQDHIDIDYRAYSSGGAFISQTALHSNVFSGREPKIDLFKNTGIDTTLGGETYAWSFDFGGWSKESFYANAYCYQYGIMDDVKILFADTTGCVNRILTSSIMPY